MKHIFKIIFSLAVIMGFAACNKMDNLPLYTSGTAPVLTASTATVAPAASDSLNNVFTLSWTNPGHATDSATYKYVIEIDSATRNFSKSTSVTVIGKRSKTFTGKELNTILLNYNYAFNVPVSMEVRVTSSYGNNNERITSNVLSIKMTPYKIPPKVALPTTGKLYIVGNATVGGDATGWNNPVPVPSQEFARLDETTWAGVFQLNGGKEYLLLPLNGDWTHKFAVADNSIPGISDGGSFGFDLGANFKSPATSGLYKIVVDFQSGKFTVTPYTSVLPTNLFIVGNATPGGDATGWNNPVPVPSQQFTRLNSSVWQLTIPLIGGKEYLLLPTNGDWTHKYAVANTSLPGLGLGGEFGYDLGSNFPAPATSGTYTITVNFAAPTTLSNSSGKFTVQ